jgi:hypothetical protein
VEGLAEEPAQDAGCLAAGAGAGAERTLGAALGVARETGDEEGEYGQEHAPGDDDCDDHE